MPYNNRLASLLEIIANAGTGGLAQMGGGLAYLPAAALGGDKAGQSVKAAVENAYTYQPRTEGAKSMLGMVGEYAAPLVNYGSQKVQQAADAAYQATGSPAVGAAVKTLPSLLEVVADRARIGKTVPDRMDMTAYHGSPHDFDQFDISKIGTGEGAQVYGHGLYFAESPDVAKQYQKGLSDIDWTTADPQKMLEQIRPYARRSDRAFDIVGQADYGGVSAKELKGQIEDFFNEMHQDPDFQDSAMRAAKQSGAGTAGRLYTVDIPDEQVAKFLDYDSVIPADRVKNAQAALDEAGASLTRERFDHRTQKAWVEPADIREVRGSTLYDEIASVVGNSRASELLKKHGFPGIRYLDQGSRSGGKGTSNFVVFDDKLVKVLKKE